MRYDDLATPEQKRADLQAITALTLSDQVINHLLAIEDEAVWRAVDAQIMRLLERVMSGEVREDNIQSRRDNLPNLISATYSEGEARVIQAITEDLLRINTFYNEELTRQQQMRAAADVPVEVRSFASGQMIIRAGEIAAPSHIEALSIGLLDATNRRTARIVGGLGRCPGDAAARRLHRALRAGPAAQPSHVGRAGGAFLLLMFAARLFEPGAQAEPCLPGVHPGLPRRRWSGPVRHRGDGDAGRADRLHGAGGPGICGPGRLHRCSAWPWAGRSGSIPICCGRIGGARQRPARDRLLADSSMTCSSCWHGWLVRQ